MPKTRQFLRSFVYDEICAIPPMGDNMVMKGLVELHLSRRWRSAQPDKGDPVARADRSVEPVNHNQPYRTKTWTPAHDNALAGDTESMHEGGKCDERH